jgi:hypothetical protein
VVKDASRWEVDTEKDASEFDTAYYQKLLGKAWEEVAFVLWSILNKWLPTYLLVKTCGYPFPRTFLSLCISVLSQCAQPVILD